MLGEVFAESYRDAPEAKEVRSIELWGVTIDAANPVNARVSVVLMKFLRARWVVSFQRVCGT